MEETPSKIISLSAVRAEKEGKRPARRLFFFIQEVKEELKKVSWTSREELLLSTKLVVLATFIFGLGIYLADLLIKGSLDGISGFVKLFG